VVAPSPWWRHRDRGRQSITREYVNKLEAGRYDPTVGVLKRIAKALGVPVTELLE